MKIITIPSISRAQEFCKENFNDNCPFINYDFFQLLEHSNCTGRSTGWIPEHILILENEKTVGFIPNFRKLHSYGEFIFDHIFENAFYQLGYDYFPKFLSAIPFTPVTRNNFIYISKSINENKVLKNLTLFLQKQNISSFHINFIDKNISEKLKKFFKRTGIQYHWHNNQYDSFNDFLNDLKSRKKKYYKRKKISR